jgi:hypothetical protein
MGTVLRNLSDRIITGFVIVWITAHQAQIAKAENQLSLVAILLFLLFPVSWAKESLATVALQQYRLQKKWLIIILEIASTGFLWVLISIVSNLYNESLKPFVTFDTIYRTVIAMFVVGGIVVLVEEFPRTDATKTE